MVLKPMATDAKEPTFSMGDDTPFAAVATRPRPAFNFLKQRFAQVSNPPIDHLRERLVMSLRTCLGRRRPLLTEDPAAAQLLELSTFFLYPGAIDFLLDTDRCVFRAEALDATFAVADGPGGLATGVEALTDRSARRGRARHVDPRRLRRGHRTRPRADPVTVRARRGARRARRRRGANGRVARRRLR